MRLRMASPTATQSSAPGTSFANVIPPRFSPPRTGYDVHETVARALAEEEATRGSCRQAPEAQTSSPAAEASAAIRSASVTPPHRDRPGLHDRHVPGVEQPLEVARVRSESLTWLSPSRSFTAR